MYFANWYQVPTSEPKMLEELLAAVRLPLGCGNEIQMEVMQLARSAQADLMLGGIKKSKVENFNDPLIHRAIILYVKSEFGLDNPDSEKYRDRYETLKKHLMMSSEYIGPEEETEEETPEEVPGGPSGWIPKTPPTDDSTDNSNGESTEDNETESTVENNEIVLNGESYLHNVGQEVVYIYCLNVSDITANSAKPGYIVNIEASTFYDSEILKVKNYVVDENDMYSDMFPVLCTAGLVSNNTDGEILFNASNLNGIKFDTEYDGDTIVESAVLIKVVFEVIAEGSAEIKTVIKNSQKFGETLTDDLVSIIQDEQVTGEMWSAFEMIAGIQEE